LNISFDELAFIDGVWEGTGHAEYPTITSLDYSEKLIFAINNKDDIIHYEQQTWIKSPDERNGEPIFWESGFIIYKGNELFELVNTQKSGRVEILRGTAKMLEKEKIKLELESVSILNDTQMIRSGRVLNFSKDTLQYQLKMSTEKNPSYKTHLTAQLVKREKD
jgi:THAP4-like, heme-binding beta-barrel domain